MDIEAAEASIDAFIERRARGRSEANDLEAAYAESVRRYHARRREQNRRAWIRFFDRMAKNHARLSARYEERAAMLLREDDRKETA